MAFRSRLPASDDPFSGDIEALTDRETRTIYIGSWLSDEKRETAFCHELVHAMCGYTSGLIEDAAQEHVAGRLETPLRALLASGQIASAPEEVE